MCLTARNSPPARATLRVLLIMSRTAPTRFDAWVDLVGREARPPERRRTHPWGAPARARPAGVLEGGYLVPFHAPRACMHAAGAMTYVCWKRGYLVPLSSVLQKMDVFNIENRG